MPTAVVLVSRFQVSGGSLTEKWHLLATLRGIKTSSIGVQIAVIETFAMAQSLARMIKSYGGHIYHVELWKATLAIYGFSRDSPPSKGIAPLHNRVWGKRRDAPGVGDE